MVAQLPANVTELCPGHVYAVTGYVPASMRVTWMTPGLEGVLGVSCYVVRDGSQALLIDTGLAVHREDITAGLEAVLAGASARAMIMTRREPDSIINLPWLVRRFGVDPVYCGGALNPVDFFERVDKRNAEAQIHAIAKASVTWVPPGRSIKVGNLAVDVLRTRLSVLPKIHIVERVTGTLFASDSWGSLAQPKEGPIAVVRGSDPRLAREPIAHYLGHKFDWLLGIDTGSVANDIAALAAETPDRICPAYGAVIEGSDLVHSTILETAEAIRMLAKEPLKDRLRGLSAEELRRAAA